MTTSDAKDINGSSIVQVFFRAILGNIMEYYDFTVYSIFAITIGKAFFPMHSPATQMILSLSIFAIGFMTRPLGGVLFGYIGDKHGRKISMTLSMSGMTIATFIMSIVPTYDSIGITGPIIIVLMRLVQGLCLSGEGINTAVFVLEHYYGLKQCLICGIVNASNMLGTALAAIVGIVFSIYVNDHEYIWRYAFGFGAFIGFIAVIMSLLSSETPIFAKLRRTNTVSKSPIIELFQSSFRQLLVVILIAGAASSMIYILKSFINIYCVKVLGLSEYVSQVYLLYTALVSVVCIPFFGFLGDLFGKIIMTIYSVIITIILIVPTFYCIVSTNHIISIIGVTLLAILSSAVAGNAYIFAISLFPPAQRSIGVGFGYNFGIVLFGGTTPAISVYLLDVTGLSFAPALYIIFVFSLLLFALYINKEIFK